MARDVRKLHDDGYAVLHQPLSDGVSEDGLRNRESISTTPPRADRALQQWYFGAVREKENALLWTFVRTKHFRFYFLQYETTLN